MVAASVDQTTPWCVVTADADGPECKSVTAAGVQWLPLPFCRLGGAATLLQTALCRARLIAPAARIMVTVAEPQRGRWRDILWYVRPENRFISDGPGWSAQSSVAAVLAVATSSPSSPVAILPATCYVTDERALIAGLRRAVAALPAIPDRVITLGITGADTEVDEDYLVPASQDGRAAIAIAATARRPVPWVARHLLERGALVASGIYVGYASVLGSLLKAHWNGAALAVARRVLESRGPGAENRVPCAVSTSTRFPPRTPWGQLPWMSLRAVTVPECGWSGLRTARAVDRIARHNARATKYSDLMRLPLSSSAEQALL